jgi:hypothetical protein
MMNALTENSLLDLAATALQEQLGYPVRVGERERRLADEYPVRQGGRLFIGEQEHSFVLETRKNLTQALIDQLHAVTLSQEPVALVVPYVSDKLGQELQRRGVCYLDTAGNAYLQTATPDFFILIRGNRQPKASTQMQHRAFQPAGVQLLYHLLSEPALLQASYRAMAEQAQVALGSVSILLKGLQQLELLREESGKRRWTDPSQVLRRWVDAYGEVVRPKLPAQRYRWLDPAVARQGWQDLDLGPDMAWGGEPAAHLLLDGYLLPEYFTLYNTATRGEVMRRLKLVPDATGKVEVLRPMDTTLGPGRPQPQAVHPLLAYADLLLTADPRNREVAHLLHEHYLSHLA